MERVSLFGDPLPRRCRKCGETKPVAAFCRDESRADGHGYICFACNRVTLPHIPNRIERAVARLRGRAWCRQCSDWHPASEVTKQGLCREHSRAEDRRRYATDATYRAERRQHAKARKRGIDPVPVIGQEALMEAFGGQCAYCPKPASTWDHVVAISRGGRTEPSNIVPACPSCNSSKSNDDVWEWLRRGDRTPCDQFIERAVHYLW